MKTQVLFPAVTVTVSDSGRAKVGGMPAVPRDQSIPQTATVAEVVWRSRLAPGSTFLMMTSAGSGCPVPVGTGSTAVVVAEIINTGIRRLRFRVHLFRVQMPGQGPGISILLTLQT